MLPAEFIERLHRHYAKRHASPLEQELWVKEMIGLVAKSDRLVLDRAYDLIRDQHEERAFPLPATLRRYIARAAEQVYPDNQRGTGSVEYKWPPAPTYVLASQVQLERDAREWQAKVMAEYGSWAKYWRATRHLHVSQGQRPVPREGTTIALDLPLAKRRRVRTQQFPNVSRPAFEKMMGTSPNQRLYVDHAALAKRITGERE